jgi:phosphatidylglycerol lysyltransferase
MGASLVGHLTKGFDFEEATIAFIAGIVLLLSRKEYNVHTDPRLRTKGIQTAIIAIISVFIYGIVGFYFLNKRNFHIDFSLSQSVIYTFENFFLFRSDELIPKSRLAHTFIYTIQASGLLTLGFLFYMFLRSLLIKNKPTDEELQRANALLKAYGTSTLDYFKTYTDKSLFVPQNIEAFLAFRISGSFAVVLENPVAASNQDFKACVTAFERYCKDNGLKDIYYRVPKLDLNSYTDLNKKVMRIGEEAVVDAFAFSLQGAAMKSIRNANNKIRDKGFVCKVYNPPLKDGFIQKLKAVSDAWLRDLERDEMVFSQGMFNEAELKNQAVLAVENEEEKVVAFVNIIPDYKKGEGTYDLIRKTENAPNGMMDFLMTELFQYFKTNGIQFVNIGFVPISGDNESKKIIKKTLNFAYKNIASFSHYKGQREFKDKFKPEWEQRYLIYTNDFDLINIPAALKKVIKPV